jgi:Flp pilus assembly protein TadD
VIPTRGRIRRWALLALLIGAAHPGPSAGDEPPAAVRLLLLPPEDLTRTPALGWVGEGIAVSVAKALAVPGSDVVGRETRVGIVEAAGLPASAPLSRASMLKVGSTLEVDCVMFGSYTGTADALKIRLHVLDMRTIKLGMEIVVSGPARTLPELENELAWAILDQTRVSTRMTREEFRARTRSVPNESFVWYVRALSKSDPESRHRLLLKAVEAWPEFPDALALVAEYHYRKGDCGRTLEWLGRVGTHDDVGPEAGFMLANCQLSQGQIDQAVATYTAVLARADGVELRNNLGVACVRAGQYARAVEHLAAAAARARGDAMIAANMAIAHQLRGNDHAAQLALQEALSANPGNGLLHFLQYRSLRAQGAEERALAALTRAIQAGTDTEKLKAEDPRDWLRLSRNWSGGTGVLTALRGVP